MNEQEIREKVEARVKAKMGFLHNLVTYLIVNAILAVINILTPHNRLWFLWVAGLWGIAIVIQFLRVFVFPEHRVEEMKNRMFEEEMKRERERQKSAGSSDDEKPAT